VLRVVQGLADVSFVKSSRLGLSSNVVGVARNPGSPQRVDRATFETAAFNRSATHFPTFYA